VQSLKKKKRKDGKDRCTIKESAGKKEGWGKKCVFRPNVEGKGTSFTGGSQKGTK